MRYLLLLPLLVAPSLLEMPHGVGRTYPTGAGYGRGFINPPTAAELAQQKCLATMIYGEARGEKKTGQVAVAYSALNRLTSNKTLCDVVLAPKQYSIFNNNPELVAAAKNLHLPPARKNVIDQRSWEEAQKVAELVIKRRITDPTNGSTHYLAPKLMKSKGYRYPKWSKEYTLVVVIDNHKFYKNEKFNPSHGIDKYKYVSPVL